VNWEAISAIGQLVGAFAVVISQIYLASEVRSNARATRLASMRSMSDAFNRWVQDLAEHPHLSELYYRGIHDFESLEGADLVRFSALMDQLFRVYEEMYYQQLEGIWIHACGVGLKRQCATSTDILVFRPGGVHARIGSVRSLRSSSISDSRQPRLQGCIANQIQINDLTNTPANGSTAPMRSMSILACMRSRAAAPAGATAEPVSR
jgi:hypothetical protein